MSKSVLSAIYITKPLIEALQDCEICRRIATEEYEGEMFLFQAFAEYGRLSAHFYDQYEEHAEGLVWPYEVDEPFGEILVQRLIHGEELPKFQEMSDIMYGLILEAKKQKED